MSSPSVASFDSGGLYVDYRALLDCFAERKSATYYAGVDGKCRPTCPSASTPPPFTNRSFHGSFNCPYYRHMHGLSSRLRD
jgi:hypothetical protein